MFWYDALGGIALGLIAQVDASFIAICGKSIDKKALQTIFCLVLTFNYVTNKLSQSFKNIIRIKKNAFSNSLTLAHIKSHNYDLDSNFENNKDKNTMVLFLSPFSSIPCSSTFVQSTCNTDEIFCQLFSILLVDQACAKNSQNELQKEHSNLFGKQAIDYPFPYKVHRLLYYCNLPAIATDQLAIGKYYVQLELDK